MKSNEEYIRVGTQYYKVSKIPSAFGFFRDDLIPWDKQTIKDDEGASKIYSIKKYNGFTFIPNHKNYSREALGFYNKYFPLLIEPNEGEWPTIENFLQHVFGEQYQLALDYLTLLYNNPTHFLPVLCLVSHSNNTGKSTFLKFLQLIFGENVSVNTSRNYRSTFNDDWMGKLIIAVEEANLCQEEDIERIKYLTTSREFKAEGKHKVRIKSDFFGKFILISNREKDFIRIDNSETRFWVVKPNTPINQDPYYLNKLEKEVSHFIHFLSGRNPDSPNESRLWFTVDQYENEALLKVKRFSKSRCEIELLQILQDICDEHSLIQIEFTLSDAFQFLKHSGIKVERIYLTDIVKRVWGIEPAGNSLSYTRYSYSASGSTQPTSSKGRYYQINYTQIAERLG